MVGDGTDNARLGVIAHGVDLTPIARIAKLRESHGERFLNRVFTQGEQGYALSGGPRVDERLAARFAAKEAVMKCLGTGWAGGVGWCEIEVVKAASGGPELVLHGQAQRVAEGLGVRRWHLSLSHAGGLAMASAIASGDLLARGG